MVNKRLKQHFYMDRLGQLATIFGATVGTLLIVLFIVIVINTINRKSNNDISSTPTT